MAEGGGQEGQNWLFVEGVEGGAGADEEFAVHDDGGGPDFFAHVVDALDLPFTARLEDGDLAGLGREEDFSVGGDGGGEVAVHGFADAALLEDFTGAFVEGGEDAGVLDEVDHVAEEQRRGDVGQRLVVAPTDGGGGHVSPAPELDLLDGVHHGLLAAVVLPVALLEETGEIETVKLKLKKKVTVKKIHFHDN